MSGVGQCGAARHPAELCATDGCVSRRVDRRANLAVSFSAYTVAGELVYEQDFGRVAKIWNGSNLGGQLVEAGVYVITGVSRNGNVYEGKVAVIR